jgi:hypothetical protein
LRDSDFKAKSYFLAEVEEAGLQIAIHPEEIRRKCISLTLENKNYFFPLPYRFNDN